MNNFSQAIYIICFGLAIFTIACQSPSAPSLTRGEGFVEVDGGKVWYNIVGEGENTPLLLLHGGPGFPSYYLNPMAVLGKDRPIIFIDQLGCGRSDRTIDTTMMTVENFVEQLEQVRAGLGLEDFYLYGHSWGTMLGIDYYTKYPKHVKALIMASPALSVSKWTEDAEALIATLPDTIQSAIKINTEKGTYEDPAFQEAIGVYYQKFLASKLPWDANMDSTFANANQDLYNYMWGPSEFRATGNLKDFERSDQLKEVKVPTLFVCGEFDEVRPTTARYYQSLVPDAEFTIIQDAAHITMHDNKNYNNRVISNFLASVDKRIDK